MKAVINFTEDSPYYKSGEQQRVVLNLTEVHYSYPSHDLHKRTAFESDIDATGFTVLNEYIKDIEITLQTNHPAQSVEV